MRRLWSRSKPSTEARLHGKCVRVDSSKGVAMATAVVEVMVIMDLGTKGSIRIFEKGITRRLR